jgi:GNAT superfamily N-acetyltransferase
METTMSEHDFRVEPLKPENTSNVQALWSQMYSEEQIAERTRIFDWFAWGNPQVTEEVPPYYLLLDGDRVVGMHGHAPWGFSLKGRRERGFMCYDDMLSMEYRGKGLGKIMLNGVAEVRPELAGALWHNEANNRLYAKAGWHDFTDFCPFVKIYDPGPRLRARLGAWGRLLAGPARLALRIREALQRRGASSAYTLERVERFGSEFDAFFASVEDQFDAIVVRDSTYLNWKFVDKPFTPYERWAARDADGKLAGYVVFRVIEQDGELSGKVLDVLADPRSDAFSALVSKALDEMRPQGVAEVPIACTLPAFGDALRRLGFVQTQYVLHFMILHFEGRAPAGWEKSARHWYLTYSDGDGDCWSTT